MGARYYDPETSEFLSPDPYGYTGTTNLYTYANADPINYHDPDGRLYQSAHATIAPKVSTAWNVGSLLVGLNNQASLGTTHTSLDVMGMVPVAGAVPDLVNAGMYSARGKYTDAGFSLAAATPIVGLVATPTKYGKKLGSVVSSNLSRKNLNIQTKTLALTHDTTIESYAGGYIKSFVQPHDQIYYRVFSTNKVGRFLTEMPPRSKEWAQNALSLPPSNKANYLQEVFVPKGTRIQRSRALPAFGKRGGGEQFELLEKIKTDNFKPEMEFLWNMQK